MTVKLLTEQHLEFLSLKGSCTGSSESTLVKMPHCWKSHVNAQIFYFMCLFSVPEEAVAFLGAVGAFLAILVVFFLYLNKLLCFSSCGGFPCLDQKPHKKERKSSKLGKIDSTAR